MSTSWDGQVHQTAVQGPYDITGRAWDELGGREAGLSGVRLISVPLRISLRFPSP